MAKGKNILVVEDSDLVAGMLTEFLEGSGCTVIRAANGLEGILLAYREIPDLIVMDVEMPVLQGYQASRLLKSRRGVRDIPIIMHTSLSEDRDEFWALSSGADAFITKDFENLDPLLEKIRSLAGKRPVDTASIREDGARMDDYHVMEMLGTTLDRHLFQSVILNRLSGAGCCIESLRDTAEQVLGVFDSVCGSDIASILLRHGKECLAYVKAGTSLHERDTRDFLKICMEDFYRAFPEASKKEIIPEFIGARGQENPGDADMKEETIRSYAHWPLNGHCGPVGTLHAGNRINNYYSEVIGDNVRVFAEGAASILENAMLMKSVSEMERNIRNVFSKFVPAEIIDDMAGQGKASLLLSGEKRNVAVLFSDIRSFTEISELNKPEDVVAFLNRYFETMAGAVLRHGGTVDKFIGDAILAVFGAPKAYDNNAERAVNAAFDMLRSLADIDTGGLVMPKTGLDMGIGIHEGDAIVGNIGSRERFDYTVIGDTVNLASRLEGLTKFYKSHIIVSQSVRDKLKDRITFREIDRVRVKGKDIPTTIYKMENVRKHRITDQVMLDYNKAMSMYRIQNWETATEYFNRVLEKIPDDYVSAMYVERCRKFAETPPPPDWDGTQNLTSK